jgi:hypothetical protein
MIKQFGKKHNIQGEGKQAAVSDQAGLSRPSQLTGEAGDLMVCNSLVIVWKSKDADGSFHSECHNLCGCLRGRFGPANGLQYGYPGQGEYNATI